MANDVAENDRRVSYTATAGQKVFDIDFPMDSGLTEEDLAMYQNGTELTLNTHYTVDLTTLEAELVTGATEGDSIVIEGDTARTRSTAFPVLGNLRTAILNGDFRKVFYILQELVRDTSRTLQLNKAEGSGVSALLPLASAAKLIGWNSDGTALENKDIANVVSDYDSIFIGLSANDYLQFDGTSWVNKTPEEVRSSLSLGALALLGAVDTDEIEDDAITLAKMEHGAQGDILFYGADGVPVRLNAGSAGQVLVSGGSGENPSWGDAVIPIGGTLEWNGDAPPANYLVEDGSAVSRATYAALFSAIGTTHGAGDGSTTFNVPDSRRRTSVGSGGSGTGILGNSVGDTGGSETHQLTLGELPSGAQDRYPNSTWLAGNSGTNNNVYQSGLTTGWQGSNQAHNNVQPSIVKMKCIRYA